MDDLSAAFERHRGHLHGVARRMLGSAADADDAIQEAWLRLARSDAASIDNLGGWLTTVVSRVCLDALRQRSARADTGLDTHEPIAHDDGPEDAAVLADSIGAALLVVLDTLPPAERVAFVLHDVFAAEFDQIASVLGSSSANARQLASRGRRRVRGAGVIDEIGVERRRALVEAFLAAARNADFDGLLTMLAPDATVRPDALAVARGATPLLTGAEAVAAEFARRRAAGATPALIDGQPGAIWTRGTTVMAVFRFTFDGDRIRGVTLTMEPADVASLTITA